MEIAWCGRQTQRVGRRPWKFKYRGRGRCLPQLPLLNSSYQTLYPTVLRLTAELPNPSAVDVIRERDRQNETLVAGL